MSTDSTKASSPASAELAASMNVSFGQRIFVFIAATLLMVVLAGVISLFVASGNASPARVRIAIVVQDLLMFVLPPLIAAMIASRRPADLLLLHRPGRIFPYILVIAALITMIPAMNRIVALNEHMQLPQWLAGMEQWMERSEQAARQSTEMMLGGTSAGALVINILIVGVMAGFAEEIFFRGGLQQLLITRPMNPHAAIWLTAVIFSAFHMQFYGFVPRMLLGAYFGYLAWWSGTIWLPVAAHVLNNSTIVVSKWLLANGYISLNLDNVGAAGDGADALVAVTASVVCTALIITLIYRALRPKKAHAQSQRTAV